MEYSEILYAVEDGVATITLNRPAQLNAWTGMMDTELRDALRRADRDSNVRTLILTGAGRGFCAGADMGSLNTIADAGSYDGFNEDGGGDGDDLSANYRQLMAFPLTVRKPLICAVNGPAAGLGLVLTLYCDLRFASEQARFGTAFATLGLIAEHGISWLLPRLVGIANALDLLYSARVIGADEALRMGLVNRVYAHDELLPAAKEYARTLAERSSPHAMSVIKRLVWDAQFQNLAQATQAANRAAAATFTRPDFREGINAFVEKRAPRFQPLDAE